MSAFRHGLSSQLEDFFGLEKNWFCTGTNESQSTHCGFDLLTASERGKSYISRE